MLDNVLKPRERGEEGGTREGEVGEAGGGSGGKESGDAPAEGVVLPLRSLLVIFGLNNRQK